MIRITFFIAIVFLYSCGEHNKRPAENKQGIDTLMYDDYILTTRFNAFDTTVEVLFWLTKDSISQAQKVNLDGFVAKQDSLIPEIFNAIFKFYKKSYPAYKEGWTTVGNISDSELEKYLPIPTNPEN